MNAFELAITVEPADIDSLGHVNNVTYLRWVPEIRRASDGAVLASAKTVWCPIDARTMKPVAVSAEVRTGFSTQSAGGPATAS